MHKGDWEAMVKRAAKIRAAKKKAAELVPMSVSFPHDDYTELKALVADTRVSIAWVVRDAGAKYFYARTPPFGRKPSEATS